MSPSGGEKKQKCRRAQSGEGSSLFRLATRWRRKLAPSSPGYNLAKGARCFAWLHSAEGWIDSLSLSGGAQKQRCRRAQSDEGSSLCRLARLWRKVLAVPPGYILAKGARCFFAWPRSGERCSLFRLAALGGRLDRLIEPQRRPKKS